MPAVQPEFLPPDPSAEAPPAPQPAARPTFLPPHPSLPQTAQQSQNTKAVWAMIFGSASLGLLAFSAGLLFFITLPASIAGWVLGARAKREQTGRDQANVAVTIAIVGVVLSVIAGAVWITLMALGEYSTSSDLDGGNSGLRFDVIRLALPV
jgi:hypothetical protein